MILAPASGSPSDAVLSSPQTPSPSSAGGGSFSWAAGIYAAPRRENTLRVTYESMQAAGFDPIICAEPNTVTPPGAPVFFNEKRKGNFHNYLGLCRRLLADFPDANVLVTAQDDALFHPDSKTFTETVLWPSDKVGFINLYTAKHYTVVKGEMLPVGVRRVETNALWGDLGLVWPRASLEAFVNHPIAVNWKGTPGDLADFARAVQHSVKNVNPYLRDLIRSGKGVSVRKSPRGARLSPYPRGSDHGTGMVMNALGLEMWFVDPSPVSHIALFSTIPGHGDNTGRRNCFRCADHSLPLREQVFPACQAGNLTHTPAN